MFLALPTRLVARPQGSPDPGTVPSIVDLSNEALGRREGSGRKAGWIYTNEGRVRVTFPVLGSAGGADSVPAEEPDGPEESLSADDIPAEPVLEVVEEEQNDETVEVAEPEPGEAKVSEPIFISAGEPAPDSEAPAETRAATISISAGEDQTILLPDRDSLPVLVPLEGTTEPQFDAEVTWTQVSGPDPVGFLGSRSLDTRVAIHAPGDYVLRLRVDPEGEDLASGQALGSGEALASDVRISVILSHEDSGPDVSPGPGTPWIGPDFAAEPQSPPGNDAIPLDPVSAPAEAQGTTPGGVAVAGEEEEEDEKVGEPLEEQIFAASAGNVSSPDAAIEDVPEPVAPESVGAEARVFFVSPSGDDANTGAETSPFRTLRKAFASAGPGDSIVLREGVYDQAVHSSSDSVPSGTSFENAVIVSGYPGETAVLEPVSGLAILHFVSPVRYTVWRNLVLDGSKLSYGRANGIDLRQGADHNRFVNLEVRNLPGSGVYLAGDAGNTHNEFIAMDVHDVALGPDGEGDGIRVAGSDNLVEGGEWHDVDGSSGQSVGIRIDNGGSGADRNVVRDAKVYANRFGILFGGGDENLVYNNLFYDNLDLAVRIDQGDASDGNSFLNNTVVANVGVAVSIGTTGTLSDTRVINNILWNNGLDVVADSGTGTLAAANLSVDPLFLDADARDFRLTPGSPAVDAGLSLVEVSTDRDGTARPQGLATDAGAYELPEGGL